jgi:hypothetical protein
LQDIIDFLKDAVIYDYSRLAMIKYFLWDADHYYLIYLGRKPDIAAMTSRWYRVHKDVYSGKMIRDLSLSLVPEMLAQPKLL